MVCGSFSFAIMGTLAHELRGSCPWQVIAIARSGMALVLSALLVRAAGARFVFLRPGTLWVRSIAGSISLVCTFFALTRLPVSDVLTVTNMFPIWVAVLSWPMLGEAPPRSVWLTVACAITGVVLIHHPHFAERNIASLAVLVASFATAFAMIGLHRLQDIDTRAVVAHFSAVSTAFCVAALPFADFHSDAVWHGSTIWMLLGVGLTATIGQLWLTKAFAQGTPAKVSVVGLTQIVFAIPLEVVFTGRQFTPLTLVGIALVLAPTAWLLASESRKRLADTKAHETGSRAEVLCPSSAPDNCVHAARGGPASRPISSEADGESLVRSLPS
jgi:drug/metabolite transporter (DMT)-like permease